MNNLWCRRCQRHVPLAEWRAIKRQQDIPARADNTNVGYGSVYEHRCGEMVVRIARRPGARLAAMKE